LSKDGFRIFFIVLHRFAFYTIRISIFSFRVGIVVYPRRERFIVIIL
jgi:hypothetical protein